MLTESKHKWKKLLQYYLLCNSCNKNDANKIRDFIHNPNNSSSNNNNNNNDNNSKQNEQEIIEKSKLTLEV